MKRSVVLQPADGWRTEFFPWTDIDHTLYLRWFEHWVMYSYVEDIMSFVRLGNQNVGTCHFHGWMIV